ncbi:Uncharacterized protein Fot_19550 [Forsythia ovata]|uniref:Uncharacterized protein n=1 Tax=Forsythia ovata TaxID=205694 RepID=A0ABD1VLD0_9LAMI
MAGQKEDIFPQPPVLRTTSVPEVTVPQTLKAIVGTSTVVLLASRIVVDIRFVLPLEETLLPLVDIRRSCNKKMVADDEGETTMPRRGTEGDDSSRDSRKTK